MGIFDRFKKAGHNPDDQLELNAAKNSSTAVSYAESFQKRFDYSKRSIADLEEILDFYSNDISQSQPTENQIWSMAVIFGSYLGETMLKNGLAEKGYKWGMDNYSNVPLLVNNDKFITPNDKVYKRLVNGKEDSVISFYDFFYGYLKARPQSMTPNFIYGSGNRRRH